MIRARVFFLPAASLVASLTFATPALAQAPPAAATPVQAQEVQQVRDEVAKLKQDFDLLRQQYDDRLAKLEERLKEIGGTSGPAAASAAATAAAAPATVAPKVPLVAELPVIQTDASQGQAPAVVQGVSPGASKVFNPDMSAIGNFVGVAGKNPMSTDPAMQLSEAEVSLQAILDPYARADFFLSAGPETLSVEEGFVTFNTLPGSLLLKAGKMRAQFGKVNTLHTHAMPTADRPLVTENLVGGEDGLSDCGHVRRRTSCQCQSSFLESDRRSVQRAPRTSFRATIARSSTTSGESARIDDLTEASNIDLGTSFAYGPTDVGQTADVRHRRGAGSAEQEAVRHRRHVPVSASSPRNLSAAERSHRARSGAARTSPAATRQTAFGCYGLTEYQFAQRWYLGRRVRSDPDARWTAPLDDHGGVVLHDVLAE